PRVRTVIPDVHGRVHVRSWNEHVPPRQRPMKLEPVFAAKGSRVFTTTAATPIRDAIGVLAANNIGALIVVDGGELPVGILSERDIIRALARGGAALEATVGDLMSSPVTVAAPAEDADSVLRTMTGHHFRHVPVVEDGRLVGMVTIADLVKARLNDALGAIDRLENRLLAGEANS